MRDSNRFYSIHLTNRLESIRFPERRKFPKVPRNESSREGKFHGTFVPGSESSRERKFDLWNLISFCCCENRVDCFSCTSPVSVGVVVMSTHCLPEKSDPAGGAHDAPTDPLVGWGGGYPLPIPTPSTPTASRSRRLWRLVPNFIF